MAKQVLTDLAAEVTRDVTVKASAVTLINGFAARVQAAIDTAIANGATAEEIAPVQAEVDSLRTSSDDLAAAVLANTPAA